MKVKKKQKEAIPAGAVILAARGYQRNGKGLSIVKYRVNGEIFVIWIPGGGAA